MPQLNLRCNVRCAIAERRKYKSKNLSGAQENPPPGFQVQSTLVLENCRVLIFKQSLLCFNSMKIESTFQSGRLAVLHFSFPVCLLNIVLDVHMCVTTEEEEPIYVD